MYKLFGEKEFTWNKIRQARHPQPAAELAQPAPTA